MYYLTNFCYRNDGHGSGMSASGEPVPVAILLDIEYAEFWPNFGTVTPFKMANFMIHDFGPRQPRKNILTYLMLFEEKYDVDEM